MEAKPWFKSYEAGMPHTLKPYPVCTLLDIVSETVKRRPEQTALMFKGRRMSYAELDKLCSVFGAALAGLGVKKGERVALLLPNSPQAIIAQLGAWKAGAIVCPINSLYTEPELEHALNECGAETVVTLTPFYQKVKQVQGHTGVKRVIASSIKDYLSPVMRLLFTLLKEKKEGHWIELQAGDYWMMDLMRQHAGASGLAAPVEPKDPAILLFSGGTTGTPKCALGTHQSLVITAIQLHTYAKSIINDWTDVIILIMPMFHIYGNMGMCTSLVARWQISLVPNPRDLDDVVATINKTRPAILHGVPTLFNSLMNHPAVRSGKADFSSLKVCYSAAAPLMAETKQRFEKLTGGRLLEAYAMTETMLATTVCPVNGVYKIGSTGIPVPDVDVRIVDLESGKVDLPANEPGEIVITAPQIMEGYWGRPEETAEMIRDGWVYTGDIGYLDEDGYLFIVDRKKDVIKPSGFQVWPREVEEVIATHPAVADVCVGGISDTAQGEAVKAWIVLNPGAQVSEDEIKDFCRQKLSAYKIPRRIEFRAALPKSMVGKTLRRLLREEDVGVQPPADLK